MKNLLSGIIGVGTINTTSAFLSDNRQAILEVLIAAATLVFQYLNYKKSSRAKN